jgi:hypothetical protein
MATLAMETSLTESFTSDKVGIVGDAFKNNSNLSSLSTLTSVRGINSKSQISPPATPNDRATPQSPQGPSDQSSDIAPEIVVWTEDMEFDEDSQEESEDASDMEIDDE